MYTWCATSFAFCRFFFPNFFFFQATAVLSSLYVVYKRGEGLPMSRVVALAVLPAVR
jgi:hypothetical protein